MNESRCDERLKTRVQEDICLTYTGLKIRECDGRVHDPDKMVAPSTPKPTRKAEVLTRAPSTIPSRSEGEVELKEVVLTRYCSTNYILETKTKVGNTGEKVPVPRTNPHINLTTTTLKSHTHPSHEYDLYFIMKTRGMERLTIVYYDL
jgi:hypothetical protein